MQVAPTIIIENLSFSFENTLIFNNLNLTLPAGQWTCLLGTSGVGKSTLLQCLAGLQPCRGIRCTDGLPLASRIAWLPQTDTLLPWATALENALLGIKLQRNVSQSDRKHAHDLFAEMQLSHATQLYPAALSGGMRQRVALIRTLLQDQPVILMDEPFAAVDAITRHTLQAIAHRYLQGKTVVFVTHDPAEAVRLGDEIYVLDSKHRQPQKIATPASATPRNLADGQSAMTIDAMFAALQNVAST